MPQAHTLKGQASTTGDDTHQNITGTRLRHCPDFGLELSPKLFKYHCMHLHCAHSLEKTDNAGGSACASVPWRAACTSAQIFSGLSGISTVLMPSGERASSTALTIAGGPPMQPDSPAPFAPSGL